MDTEGRVFCLFACLVLFLFCLYIQLSSQSEIKAYQHTLHDLSLIWFSSKLNSLITLKSTHLSSWKMKSSAPPRAHLVEQVAHVPENMIIIAVV